MQSAQVGTGHDLSAPGAQRSPSANPPRKPPTLGMPWLSIASVLLESAFWCDASRGSPQPQRKPAEEAPDAGHALAQHRQRARRERPQVRRVQAPVAVDVQAPDDVRVHTRPVDGDVALVCGDLTARAPRERAGRADRGRPRGGRDAHGVAVPAKRCEAVLGLGGARLRVEGQRACRKCCKMAWSTTPPRERGAQFLRQGAGRTWKMKKRSPEVAASPRPTTCAPASALLARARPAAGSRRPEGLYIAIAGRQSEHRAIMNTLLERRRLASRHRGSQTHKGPIYNHCREVQRVQDRAQGVTRSP